MFKRVLFIVVMAMTVAGAKAMASHARDTSRGPSSGEENPYKHFTPEDQGVKPDVHHAPEARKWRVVDPCFIPGEKTMGEQCGKRVKPPFR